MARLADNRNVYNARERSVLEDIDLIINRIASMSELCTEKKDFLDKQIITLKRLKDEFISTREE